MIFCQRNDGHWVNRRLNIRRLLTVLTPGVCLLCDSKLLGDSAFCPGCREDLPLNTSACALCGRPLLRTGLCSSCIRKPPVFDRTTTAYIYRYPVNALIRSMKYQQNLNAIRSLGLGLAETIKRENRPLPECLIPVPLHLGRLIGRGFNQAQELSIILAKELHLPIDFRLISRVRSTAPQFELLPKQRHKNVKAAFKLLRKTHYKSVAIVDDIITTGATLNELARLLRRAGVEDIEGWACARTE